MSLNWMDVSNVDFKCLLLLEDIQIKWLSMYCSSFRKELGIALKANKEVSWFFEYKCPEVREWLDRLLDETELDGYTATYIRGCEIKVMEEINDWLVYALDPSIYDNQPFLKWDNQLLLSIVDFNNKVVVDIGSGTGRLAFTISNVVKELYAVEPVSNLRKFLRKKAKELGLKKFYVVDGLITEIPMGDNFADIVMLGHVFGDEPEDEYKELIRVVKNKGYIILCPGNNDVDNCIHYYLVDKGFEYRRMLEPGDGYKRLYYKLVEKGE